jgi:hypothetical protein
MTLYVILILNAYVVPLRQGFQNPRLRLELGSRIPKIIKRTLFRKNKLKETEQLHPQMFPQIFSLILYYKSTAIYYGAEQVPVPFWQQAECDLKFWVVDNKSLGTTAFG